MGFYTRKLRCYIIIAPTYFPERWKLWSGNCLLQNSWFLYLGKYGIFGAYHNSCLEYLNLSKCIFKLISYNSFYWIWLFGIHSILLQPRLFMFWIASLVHVHKKTYCSHHQVLLLLLEDQSNSVFFPSPFPAHGPPAPCWVTCQKMLSFTAEAQNTKPILHLTLWNIQKSNCLESKKSWEKPAAWASHRQIIPTQ